MATNDNLMTGTDDQPTDGDTLPTDIVTNTTTDSRPGTAAAAPSVVWDRTPSATSDSMPPLLPQQHTHDYEWQQNPETGGLTEPPDSTAMLPNASNADEIIDHNSKLVAQAARTLVATLQATEKQQREATQTFTTSYDIVPAHTRARDPKMPEPAIARHQTPTQQEEASSTPQGFAHSMADVAPTPTTRSLQDNLRQGTIHAYYVM